MEVHHASRSSPSTSAGAPFFSLGSEDYMLVDKLRRIMNIANVERLKKD